MVYVQHQRSKMRNVVIATEIKKGGGGGTRKLTVHHKSKMKKLNSFEGSSL